MSNETLHRIPIVSLDDPTYAGLARLIVFPPSDRGAGDAFYPALSGLNIGTGSDVDVSFLYSFRHDPNNNVDRHLYTEEMFVPLDGDLCLPLAPCSDPDDPEALPKVEDFVGVVVRHGEALTLSKNVWHNGGWPLSSEVGVRYIMVLSGHRAGGGPQGRVDYITATIPGNVLIYPDW